MPKNDFNKKTSPSNPSLLLESSLYRSAPLSFAQQRMWLIDNLKSGNDRRYNRMHAIKLEGALDVSVLRISLKTIIERHESLRTTYHQVRDQAQQRIHQSIPVDIPCINISTSQLHRIIDEQAKQQFDLSRGPLVIFKILKLTQTSHILLINMHHIVTDIVSEKNFANELTKLYTYQLNTTEAPLPALNHQYCDFADWQISAEHNENIEHEQRYWRDHLEKSPVCITLPTDYSRPAKPSYEGKTHHFSFPASLTEKIKQLSITLEIPEFTILLAAFSLLLSRYSGQSEICVGSPVAGRQDGRFDNLIGFFANTIVMRCRVNNSQTVESFLHNINSVITEARKHQKVPFEKVVEAVNPIRSSSHSPLFQTMFFIQDDFVESVKLPGIDASSIPLDSNTSKYDLSLILTKSKNVISGGLLEYSSDLFKHSTIESMIQHYQVLLLGCLNHLEQRLCNISMITEREINDLITRYNNTASQYPSQQCIHEIFETISNETPNTVSIIYKNQRITYRELNKKANQLAHFLMAQGVKGEVNVGVMLARSPQMIISLLAVLKAGGCYVPIDPNYPEKRIRYIMKDSGITLLLTDSKFSASAKYCTESGVLTLDTQRTKIKEFSTDNPSGRAHPLNIAYINYTSGSTGNPKGVAVPHQAVNSLVLNNAAFAMLQKCTMLQISTVSFDAATFEIWGALLNTGTCVLYPSSLPTPQLLHEVITEHKISALFMTSALFNLIIDEKPDAFEGVTSVLVGGDVLSKEHVGIAMEKLPSSKFINCYGPTENTTFSTCHPVDKNEIDKPRSVPIGRPIGNSSAFVLDEHLNPLPIGVIGELYVGGDGLARGYLNNPLQTAEKFVPHPYAKVQGERLYKTGDLARIRNDGKIDYVARRDNQIKLRGYRIEPNEITAAILQHPDVNTAIVTTPEKGQSTLVTSLIAYIVLKKTDAIINADKESEYRESIRNSLRRQLPEYMIPNLFVFSDKIALTANGKLDHQALKKNHRPDTDALDYIAPTTEQETVLCDIWKNTLKLDRVGIRDNFFACGGDSIFALQIVSRARSKGIDISSDHLFTHQTIEQIAQYSSSTIELMPYVEPKGFMALLPIQQWFFSSNCFDHHHFNQFRLLTVPATFSLSFLKMAVAQFCKHHDALRLHFESNNERWTSHYVEFDPAVIDNIVVEKITPDQENHRLLFIEQFSQHIQSSLDINQGPLMRAVHFKSKTQTCSRLLLVVHHLVVDGVSWRILIEDLSALYQQWSTGQELSLGAKTNSLRQWSDVLDQFSTSTILEQQIPYWLTQLSISPTLPRTGDKICQNDYSNIDSVSFKLDAEKTQLLLTRCQSENGFRINELLLTALAVAFEQWTGESRLCIKLEGHGRENIDDRLDISRTVAWFTSLFPLKLQWQRNSSIGETLKSIRQQFQEVPNNGIGYGLLYYFANNQALQKAQATSSPEIVFNYLGQFDQQEGADAPFSKVLEAAGDRFSQKIFRDHALRFTGEITHRQLHFTLDYDSREFNHQAITTLQAYLHKGLLSIIEHCLNTDKTLHLPVEGLSATIEPSNMKSWQNRYGPIDQIYPTTTMQLGLIYHSMHNAEPSPAMSARPYDANSTYATQFYMTLNGRINLDALIQAWNQVALRHSVFRTAFVGLTQKQPQQLVVKDISYQWCAKDWREKTDAEFEQSFEQFRKEDKHRGFDYEEPGLMRFSIFKKSDNKSRFLWTHHHSLLDGWSIPIILDEVQYFYRGLCQAEPVQLPAPAPYGDYIKWVSHKNTDEAKAYWKSELKGLKKQRADRENKKSNSQQVKAPEQRSLELSNALTEQLRQFTRTYKVTLNSVFQASWAHTLSCLEHDHDIVFGETLSGRQIDLIEAEKMVGLLINTVPIRINIEENELACEWIQNVHCAHIKRERYGQLPLVEINQCCSDDSPRSLFNSIIAFQIPLAKFTQLNRLNETELDYSDVVCDEQTHYDLTLLITPTENITLTLKYTADRYCEEVIFQILQQLQSTLCALTSSPTQKIKDLPKLIDQSIRAEQQHSEPDRPTSEKIREINQIRTKLPYTATTIENTLKDLWADILDIDPEHIGIQDDFFSLGGHSLHAIRLSSRINEIALLKITINTIFDYPTLYSMANHLARLTNQLEIFEKQISEESALEETGVI
jgi:amino acid adenylation domain-containing protein/non-ribosomal peptide synthase protein (TIGR01720 family)